MIRDIERRIQEIKKILQETNPVSFMDDSLDHEKIAEGLMNETFLQKEADPGQHYRKMLVIPVKREDLEMGFVSIQLDPAQIAEVWGPMNAMDFTILKKILRAGTGNKSVKQDMRDIISAAKRRIELLECGK